MIAVEQIKLIGAASSAALRLPTVLATSPGRGSRRHDVELVARSVVSAASFQCINVIREAGSRRKLGIVQCPVASLIVLPAHLKQLPAVDAQSTTGLSSDAQNLTDGSSGQFAGNANGHS